MKAVYQTKFGFPHGNCFEACVASILELPLKECVIFTDGVDEKSELDQATQKHWWQVFVEWALHRDLIPVFILAGDFRGKAPRGYSIVSGKGPRGLDHSTVGCDGKIVHDPHPSRAGLLSVRDFIVLLPAVERELERRDDD